MQWPCLLVAYLEVDTLRVLWTVSSVAGLITKVLFHHCHNLHMMCGLDIKKHSFLQRVINEWNKLSNDFVNADSVNLSKNRIDRYLIRQAMHR